MKKLTKTGNIQGVLSILLLILSTFFFFIPVLFIGIAKLFPYAPWRLGCSRLIDSIAMGWCDINNFNFDRMRNLRLEYSGIDNLSPKNWYLVIANHQSWLDIVILHRIFNRKIPVLKFFIKDQLKWVPLLGFAWWAMGCPFMKRYSRDYLVKNPHKKGKDLQATEKAVRIFKQQPASIANFVEGTRFTPDKHSKQSHYRHLLPPRAGGISFVIQSMGDKINKILDVTIVYPCAKPSLWDFLCRRMAKVKVVVKQLDIPQQFLLSNLTQNDTQQEFKEWLNKQWSVKDQLIDTIKSQWQQEQISAH